MNSNGHFIIILDGFDEMPLSYIKKDSLEIFRELDRLVSDRAKVLITSRTHYFKENEIIHEGLQATTLYDSINNKQGYELIFINEFSTDDIKLYMKKYYNTDLANKYYEMIGKIYNLSDLATRPVLLNIIVKTLPQISFNENEQINTSDLYELYINYWIERDDWRRIISKEDTRLLVSLISEYLFINSVNTIHYSQIPEVFRKIEAKFDYDITLIDNELRTCNFMNRDNIGNYSFMHKSFMEYFLAYKLYIDFFDSDFDISNELYLPNEEKKTANSKIVTNEVYNFFSQMFNKRIYSIPRQDLYFVFKHRRMQNILFLTISDDYPELHFLLADFIHNSKCKIPLEKLINRLTCKSDLLSEALKYLLKLFKCSYDINHLEKVYEILKKNSIEQLPILLEFEDFLKTEKVKSFDIDTSNDYPYSRAKKKEAIKEIQESCIDEEEFVQKRKRFIREWTRKKSEYDK